MSADYDRLFHSSGAADPVDEDTGAHREGGSPAGAPPMPIYPTGSGAGGWAYTGEHAAPPMPIAPPQNSVTPPTTAPPPRASEVTSQIPVTPTTGPQRVQNGLLRTPQANPSSGARFEQQYAAPAPQARSAPAPSQHLSEAPEPGWSPPPSSPAGQPAATSAATIGNHRAIDALSHVGVRNAVKMPSQRGWRHWLYLTTRINLGPSPDEIYETDLQARVRRNARDSYQIGVFGLKGGVGKTAVTVAMGSALSRVRGDRILAIDADPDGGNLADRAGRQSAATVSDLLSDNDLSRYNDIRAYTSMNAANLEVLSSEEYSAARREFNDDDCNDDTIYVRARASLDGINWPPGQYSPTVAITEPICTGNIVVHKATDPDGSAQLFQFDPSWGGDFYLTDGGMHDSGPLPVRLYSVAEIVPEGWNLAGSYCVIAREDGLQTFDQFIDELTPQSLDPSAIGLGPGDTVHCYFANQQQGRIIVQKSVSPEGAPLGLFTFSPSWGVPFMLAGGGSHNSGPLNPGAYSVAELAPLAEGWTLASAFCSDGSSPAAIGVSAGETVICTFNNRYQEPENPGSLTIVKETTPAGGAGFGFDGTLGGFSLDDGGSHLFDDLAAGSYTVVETPAAGWLFEDVVCTTLPGAVVDYQVAGAGVTVNLAEGQDLTCTFTNRQEGTAGPEGSLTIVKRTVPAGGMGFEFDAGSLGAFSLDDGGTRTFTDLVAGAYVVTESPSAEWAFASVECDAIDWEAEGASVTVNLAEGEAAICTFTNGELPYTGSPDYLMLMLAGGLAALLMGAGTWAYAAKKRARV